MLIKLCSERTHESRMMTLAYQIRDSLYLNITDRCTLKCAFCPKFNTGVQVHDYDLGLAVRPSSPDIINAILGQDLGVSDYDEVVFCGFGEPTLRLKVLCEVAKYIKKQGGRVRLNTDGLGNLVNKRNILPQLRECVDAVSVSMNAQSEAVYNQHCQPALPNSWAEMLLFLEQAPDYISAVTATAIDGLEGVDINACQVLAGKYGVGFRARQLDIVG